MKPMQDFYDTLFVKDKVATPSQQRLTALTHLSRKQVNSIVEFTPWYLWTSETAK